jgi:hypothetical protein
MHLEKHLDYVNYLLPLTSSTEIDKVASERERHKCLGIQIPRKRGITRNGNAALLGVNIRTPQYLVSLSPPY